MNLASIVLLLLILAVVAFIVVHLWRKRMNGAVVTTGRTVPPGRWANQPNKQQIRHYFQFSPVFGAAKAPLFLLTQGQGGLFILSRGYLIFVSDKQRNGSEH